MCAYIPIYIYIYFARTHSVCRCECTHIKYIPISEIVYKCVCVCVNRLVCALRQRSKQAHSRSVVLCRESTSAATQLRTFANTHSNGNHHRQQQHLGRYADTAYFWCSILCGVLPMCSYLLLVYAAMYIISTTTTAIHFIQLQA